MELPAKLNNKIVEFLKSLPNIHDSNSQRALLLTAGLDTELQDQIYFSGSSAQFFQLSIPTLLSYGKLKDGRNLLIAVLNAAKGSVGREKSEQCETLIKELQGIIAVNMSNQTRTTINRRQYASIVQLVNSGNTKYFYEVFPYSFDDFPQCLFTDNKFDIGIIMGADPRDCGQEVEKFRAHDGEVKIPDKNVRFSRHSATTSVKDGTRTADLASFLGFHYSKMAGNFEICYPDHINSSCFLDTTVPKEVLNRNLILVGGGDVNVYVVLASIAFQEKFGFPLPVRFRADGQYYFTCGEIFSELSGKTYSNTIDSGFIHCGYLVMAANPWTAGKVMILVIGTKTTGTATALLALQRRKDCVPSAKLSSEPWHELSYNNQHYPQIPAKVVQAKSAHIIEGTEFIESSKETNDFDKKLLSSRYTITDFKFLE